MEELPKTLRRKDKLFMFMGSIISAAITLFLITNLPTVQGFLISAILLASLIVFCAYVSNPMLWWMGVGAIAGIIIGIDVIFGGYLTKSKAGLPFEVRLTFVAFQSIAGLISGVLLGRKVDKPQLPTLKDFLSSVSGITVGMFAVLVTTSFILHGIESARTLSSRLSTTTTILITLLAIPGSIGYILAQRATKVKKPPVKRDVS
jgi:hypothetical protein